MRPMIGRYNKQIEISIMVNNFMRTGPSPQIDRYILVNYFPESVSMNLAGSGPSLHPETVD